MREENQKKEDVNTERKTDKSSSGRVYVDELKSGAVNSSFLAKKMRNSNLIFENLTWLTSNEAAEYLRLPSVGALRVLVFQRRIPFHKLGRNLRFRKSELDRLLETSRTGGI